MVEFSVKKVEDKRVIAEDEVLRILRADGSIRLTLRGNSISSKESFSHIDISGGLHFWGFQGEGQEVFLNSGQKVTTGGLAIRPKKNIEIIVKEGETISIALSERAVNDKEYDRYQPLTMDTVLKVRGCSVAG